MRNLRSLALCLAAAAFALLAVPLLVVLALMARNPREPEPPVAPRPTAAPIPYPTFTQRATLPSATSSVDDGDGGVLTGELRMPVGVPRALVDGAQQNIVNRTLTLSCGLHTIKLPKRAPVRVAVPCGGSTTY